MASIETVRDIPMKDLVIGKGQVRVRDVGKNIDDLAQSIAKIGLLEPIVVAPAQEESKFEILTGQRRYLAHKQLGRDTIKACVLDGPVNEIKAKVISITENLVRTDPNSKDYIDACTALYRTYGSIKAVSDETGLPYHKVQLYVKYDRLRPQMKDLVDSGDVGLKTALKAQDAASVTGEYNPDEAVIFAKEMSRMTGAQQTRIVKKRKDDPVTPVDEIVEAAKTGDKTKQLVIDITLAAHSGLKQYAKDEDTNPSEAAMTLIMDGLTDKGYSVEE